MSFIVRKFSWKNLIRKNVFLKKKKTFFYLLLIFAPSLFWAKSLLYFSVVLNFFLRLSCYLFFFFFWSFFFWCLFFPNKKMVLKNLLRETYRFFFQHFLLNFFWRKEHRLIQKRMCSKIIIRIFFKRNIPQKKNLFQDSHALRIACANEGPLDHCCVSWRCWESQVCVHSVVIHHIRHIKPSLSFFSAFLFLRKPH